MGAPALVTTVGRAVRRVPHHAMCYRYLGLPIRADVDLEVSRLRVVVLTRGIRVAVLSLH